MPKQRVLVTGGSGHIGQLFLRHQGDRYDLRLTYHKHPFQAPPHEVVAMDLSNYAGVQTAMQGMDAVLHLGANPSLSSKWDTVLQHNIIGTYHAYEAAREAGVRRVVFASSNHAAGRALAEHTPIGPDAPIRPDSLYGVSKCFGEAMGRYYHDRYGLEVICLRIGACHGTDAIEDQAERARGVVARGDRHPYGAAGYLSIWSSPRDMAHLLACSLDADCDWGIFYGSSGNTPGSFDLSETKRALGYRPQDNVQDLFDRPIADLV